MYWAARHSAPGLITLVGPARAKRIIILCEKMGAAQALDWGLIDEIAADGETVKVAQKMAREAAKMPAATTRK